jgi:hypothetical protein
LNNQTNTHREKRDPGFFFGSVIGETREKTGNCNFLYEKDNHLGSVLVTVSDRKIPIDLGNNGSVDYYTADVVSAADMYSGGMAMPGRNFNSTSYRYGFGNHEKDDEVSGSGNAYDFGGYGYDPRLNRRKTPDPKGRMMPGYSPYAYAKCNPILYIDQDGQYPFTFFVRSYESSGVFGFPFSSIGDARTASTASDASARIHFKMSIETDGNKLEKYDAFSSPSLQIFYPIAPYINPQIGKAIPKKEASADGKGNYGFKASGAEPIMSKIPIVGGLTPDIDIKGTMKIVEKDGILNIKGQVRGDAFPDAETFIKDNSGQAIMLGTYNHGALGSPAWSLPGDGNTKMIDVNVQVELDKKGNFSKAWSIDAKGNKTALDIIAPEKKEEKK